MIYEFLSRHGALPEQIQGPNAVDDLILAMEEGLGGRGNIPMLPAFLSPNVAKVLVENFGIAGIRTVDDDIKLLVG